MQTVSLLSLGFSLFIAPVLWISFIWLMPVEHKRMQTKVFCSGFLLLISLLQIKHLEFLLDGRLLLREFSYQTLLVIAPSMFYFFSRSLLFKDYQVSWGSIAHFAPISFLFVLPETAIAPLALIVGSAYCIWLVQLIYRLKNMRNRFKLEFFFASTFAVIAFIVMVLGTLSFYIEPKYFYHFYLNGLSFAYALVVVVLLVYPNLIDELTEIVATTYRNSTLSRINIEQTMSALDRLMTEDKAFQDEQLTLGDLAERMNITAHQLSELINTQFGFGFSQYLRKVRVEHAKQLLKLEPEASVLSIGLESGFKSQSNFYSAFKTCEGVSPGQYRKASH